MLRRIGFHPEALAEAVAAAAWYRERSPATGVAFQAEVDHAIDRILEAPKRYPAYVDDTRRVLLRRFPYSVSYRRSGYRDRRGRVRPATPGLLAAPVTRRRRSDPLGPVGAFGDNSA
jgi:hypothetical protein